MTTSNLVKEYFEYRDGELYWKKNPRSRGKSKVGDRFGCEEPDLPYRRGAFKGCRFREHQLVWLLFNDTLPDYIDHIDGNGLNNRIENLRAVRQAENIRNSKLRKDNKTGCKGVWKTRYNTYQVSLTVDRKILRFGSYKDYELACLVADEARDLYHGKYARYK